MRGLDLAGQAQNSQGKRPTLEILLIASAHWVEPRGIREVPDALHPFDMGIGKSDCASRVVTELRSAPIRIVSGDAAGTISCRDIPEHPRA